MDCPNCSHEIPAHYSGLFCPKCGRSLWQAGKHEENTEEHQNPNAQAEENSQQPTYRPPQSSVPSTEGVALKVSEEPKSCPWEIRDKIGTLKGFFKTLGQSLFNPGGFFRRLPPRGGYADPILFVTRLAANASRYDCA